MTSSEQVFIDMSLTLQLIQQAQELITAVDGLDVTPNPMRNRTNDATRAESARHLLRIGNLLRMASAEAENQYHVTNRGYPDPFDTKDPT